MSDLWEAVDLPAPKVASKTAGDIPALYCCSGFTIKQAGYQVINTESGEQLSGVFESESEAEHELNTMIGDLPAGVKSTGKMAYGEPLFYLCPRCKRPTNGWQLERGDRCSPSDWGFCIRPTQQDWKFIGDGDDAVQYLEDKKAGEEWRWESMRRHAYISWDGRQWPPPAGAHVVIMGGFEDGIKAEVISIDHTPEGPNSALVSVRLEGTDQILRDLGHGRLIPAEPPYSSL